MACQRLMMSRTMLLNETKCSRSPGVGSTRAPGIDFDAEQELIAGHIVFATGGQQFAETVMKLPTTGRRTGRHKRYHLSQERFCFTTPSYLNQIISEGTAGNSTLNRTSNSIDHLT